MIRKAHEKDVNIISKLLFQVHDIHAKARNDIFQIGKRKYNDEDVLNIIKCENTPIFVYEENQVLGYVFCVIKEVKDNSSLTNRKELYIDDLCVDENHRGKNIGTKLYKFVKEYAKQINVDAITLNVWCFNESALRFYEKLGLKPLKVIMEEKL